MQWTIRSRSRWNGVRSAAVGLRALAPRRDTTAWPSGDSHAASRACWAAAKSLVVSGGAVTPPILTGGAVGSATPQIRHKVLTYASAQERSLAWMIAACAAATRAIGTRNGEHDT